MDRLTKTLYTVTAALVVGTLLTIVVGLITGDIMFSHPPQTYAQAQAVRAEAALTGDAQSYQAYILPLIETGDLVAAQATLDSLADSNFDVTQGQQLLYCQALIDYARNDIEGAKEQFTQVADHTLSAYKSEKAFKTKTKNWALANGIHDNYGQSLLYLAAIARDAGANKTAEKHFTTYLKQYKTEAGVMVDRALIREELGDLEGAAEDYRDALKYVPGFAEALTGLKRLGLEP